MTQYDLGMDARMIRHTGIGTYIRGLAAGLAETGGFDSIKTCFYSPERKSSIPGVFQVSFDAPIYSITEQVLYPRLLASCKVWHAPHYNIPFFKGSTRLIVTIHDLIHWIFRDKYFGWHQNLYSGTMLRRAVRLADAIIAVSEHTKQDLINYFRASPEKITVIYEASDASFKERERGEAANVLEKYGIHPPYFLYVGSLKPHKNVLWLIKIIRELRKAGKVKARLVVTGRKDKKYSDELAELRDLKTDDDIIYIPRTEEGEIPLLYNGAEALIHPSLYEGFGLTPLEAMASGTPVIAAANASIPEICAEGAWLVDSSSNHGIMQAIVRMETDESFRRELREKGKQRVKQFSWSQTAKQTLAVYQKVLSSS